MTLQIESKNIINFIVRRKIIIIVATLLGVALVYGYNALQKQQVTKSDKVVTTTKNDKEIYSSDLKVIIQNAQGAMMTNISAIKAMLVSHDSQQVFKESGNKVVNNELNLSTTVFTRDRMGEVLYIRVQGEDVDQVNAINQHYARIIEKREIEFFKDKTTFIVDPPTKAGTKFPVYGDYRQWTDAGSLKQGTVAKKEAAKSVSPMIGIILGLVTGLFLAMIVDLMSKTIFSSSYLQSFIADNIKNVNLAYQSPTYIYNKIKILSATSNSEQALVISEKATPVVTEIERLNEQNDGKDIYQQAFTAEELKKSESVYLLVEKGQTTTKWFQEQLALLDGTNKPVTMLFITPIK